MSVSDIQQQDAEINYIDSMFNVVTEHDNENITAHINAQEVNEVSVAAEVDSVKVANVIVDSTVDAVIADTATEQIETNASLVTDRHYQIISIQSMKFAVPLLEILKAVERTDVEIENGLLEYNGDGFAVVDVAGLIKPATASYEADYYILIDGRNLAIACNNILTTEEIDVDSVCWRTAESKRMWLAGTIKQAGLAMLDISILEQMQFSD